MKLGFWGVAAWGSFVHPICPHCHWMTLPYDRTNRSARATSSPGGRKESRPSPVSGKGCWATGRLHELDAGEHRA
jgi:hypothetical protein